MLLAPRSKVPRVSIAKAQAVERPRLKARYGLWINDLFSMAIARRYLTDADIGMERGRSRLRRDEGGDALDGTGATSEVFGVRSSVLRPGQNG